MTSNRQPTILVAEDDADDCLLMQDAFTESGFNGVVRFVGDGEELMDRLLHRGRHANTDSPRPDLILLDLNMPRKDGREALAEIRRHAEFSRLPVVIFTTSRADTDISRVYELGANSFVTKPAAFDALISTVKSITGYWFGIVELPYPSAVTT